MGAGGSQKKGYNIHQVRIYTIRDELDIKETYIDHEKAKEKILEAFSDEKYGPTYSRGNVRCLDPRIRGWIVPTAINNPNALLLDPEETAVEEWRLTLYDLGDNIIESQCFPQAISEKEAAIIMLNKNAFYGVISARELGAPEQLFTISRIQINQCFNLSVSGPDNANTKPHIPKKGENLALTFAKALAQDRAETERILKERHMRGLDL